MSFSVSNPLSESILSEDHARPGLAAMIRCGVIDLET